jgi:hypothetical protein
MAESNPAGMDNGNVAVCVPMVENFAPVPTVYCVPDTTLNFVENVTSVLIPLTDTNCSCALVSVAPTGIEPLDSDNSSGIVVKPTSSGCDESSVLVYVHVPVAILSLLIDIQR